MWNVTLELYTTTHYNVWGQTQSGNPSTHTSKRSTLRCSVIAGVGLVSQELVRKCTVSTKYPGPVVCESIMLSARPQWLSLEILISKRKVYFYSCFSMINLSYFLYSAPWLFLDWVTPVVAPGLVLSINGKHIHCILKRKKDNYFNIKIYFYFENKRSNNNFFMKIFLL